MNYTVIAEYPLIHTIPKLSYINRQFIEYWVSFNVQVYKFIKFILFYLIHILNFLIINAYYFILDSSHFSNQFNLIPMNLVTHFICNNEQ